MVAVASSNDGMAEGGNWPRRCSRRLCPFVHPSRRSHATLPPPQGAFLAGTGAEAVSTVGEARNRAPRGNASR